MDINTNKTMEIQTTKYIDRVTFVVSGDELYVDVYEKEEEFVINEELIVQILSSKEYFRRYHNSDDYSVENEKIQNIIKNFWEVYKND